MNPSSRILGGLYGSLVGDALGVPVEFAPRAQRMSDPVTDMRAYGSHGQPAGTWSDDGALLLCATESLVEKSFDTEDMGQRFVRWFERGHWSAHGSIFDIGIATRKALHNISFGIAAEQAGGRDLYDNGNGSLMRILPVSLASLTVSLDDFATRHVRASSITHAHKRSQMACTFYGLLVRALMDGQSPQDGLATARSDFSSLYADSDEFYTFGQLLKMDIAQRPKAEIQSGGYVMETLMASIWCFLTTSSFSECVLKAVNLGDDTDTTGCVAGGLAGVYYGIESIPSEWVATLPRQAELRGLFDRFIERYDRT